jgi:hypothetical protein
LTYCHQGALLPVDDTQYQAILELQNADQADLYLQEFLDYPAVSIENGYSVDDVFNGNIIIFETSTIKKC